MVACIACSETALESTPRSPNGFLSSLAADDFELIRPHLRLVDLVQDSVLTTIGEALPQAWLPHHGLISLAAELAKGERVQVGMIGRDSIYGALAALGDPIALNSAVVQVGGVASVVALEQMHAAADRSATLRSLLVRHELALFAQVQQTAGCNAAHPVEARLARCLLQTHDLSEGGRLTLTQEQLAQMIGARRNSVSLAASVLQQANYIHYSRGHIEIVDIDALRKTACECYASTKAHCDRLLRA
jgi:CRP-like cAMP-binding protein